MQLPYTLDGFCLEGLCGGSEISVFISEKLIGYLTGQQHTDISLLMDSLAEQVHSHACADSGYIICAQEMYDFLKCSDDIVLCYDDLGVVAADVVRCLLCVFQVDSVGVHADGKCAYGIMALTLRYGADK